MTKRFTKTIATMIVATFIFTGCTAKNTAPVTTETIDVTTYTVIDDKEQTVTETSKNEDGATVVITKTTDGTLVSKATTKETEGTTTTQETSKETTKVTTTEPTTSKAEPTVTEPKVTTEPTTKATEPTATPTETTKPTDTPKPTETTKPTDAPKPTEPKPTETTKPTTQPTKPTTSPTTPEPKPTTPEPTETTPEPTKTYGVRVHNTSYTRVFINEVKGTYNEFEAGTQVTVRVELGNSYKDTYTCYLEVNGANKGTSYTFTLNSDVEITVKAEEVKQPEPQYETYTTTGTVTVTYSTYADGPDVNYTKTFEHVTIVNENSVVGNPSTNPRDYNKITAETRQIILDFLTTQDYAGYTWKVTAVD